MGNADAALTFRARDAVLGEAARGRGLDIHAAVRDLARSWTLELTPREVERLGTRIPEHLPAGTRVYVTRLAGASFAASLDAARTLQRCGMLPVPHLAARAIPDRGALADMLGRLVGEADVGQVLLVAGAIQRPAGAFSSCIELLETGLFERHGIRRLGLAAHPEGSPDIPPSELALALAAKNAYAARSDIEFELTTQFCFDAAPIVAWERAARAAGNRLPVAVGLAGLASATTLIKHARNCGVGNSIAMLMSHAGKLLRLTAVVDPSAVVLDLARARQADSGCGVARLHFFPFGAFEATARYARALADGHFTVDGDLPRLQVQG